MAEIITLPPKVKPDPDSNFFTGLKLPPGVAHWMAGHAPNTPFMVFRDSATGAFAGIMRADILRDYYADVAAGRKPEPK